MSKNKSILVLVFFTLLSVGALQGQVSAESLLSLPRATTVQMNAVIAPKIGALLFNTDDDKVYRYTTTGWQAMEDNQTLALAGNLLSIEDGNNVDLAPFVDATIYTEDGALLADRTVTQNDFDLNFDVNTLVISGDDDRVGIRNSSPTSTLDIVGDFKITGSGTPTFPNRLQTDVQNLYTYVDDANVIFMSEQDETSGGSGGFRFYMDNDGTTTPTFEINNKSNTGALLELKNTGAFSLPEYGSGTFTGTETGILGVDADGHVVEVAATAINTDNQDLSLSGNILSLSNDATPVDLSTLTGLGDDLGDHTATENIQTAGNWISHDGDDEGIYVGTAGNVNIGWNGNLTDRSLYVRKVVDPSSTSYKNLYSQMSILSGQNYNNSNAVYTVDESIGFIGSTALGSINALRGQYVRLTGTSPNFTTANLIGTEIDLQSEGSATNAYGLRIGSVAGASNLNYSIYTNSGDIRFGDLASTGDRMVVANSIGVLDTQAIPVNTDNQDLSLSGNILSLSNDATPVDLSTLTGLGDDLGDHTATENIQTAGNWISNDGDNEGLYVGTTGSVSIGWNGNFTDKSLYVRKVVDPARSSYSNLYSAMLFTTPFNYTNTSGDYRADESIGVIGANVAGSVSSITGQYVRLYGTSPNFTATNLIGTDINLQSETSATNAYGLRIGDVSGASNTNYSIYTGIGDIRFGDLAGTGDRMVVANSNGVLETQAIPTGTDNQTASQVPITDAAGNYAASNVETALAELGTTKKASQVFYPPPFSVNAATPGTYSINLYAEYIAQFGSPVISSSGTIPTYTASQLDYHVTYADPAVFNNNTMSLSATGVLTYTVTAAPTNGDTFINFVFVVK